MVLNTKRESRSRSRTTSTGSNGNRMSLLMSLIASIFILAMLQHQRQVDGFTLTSGQRIAPLGSISSESSSSSKKTEKTIETSLLDLPAVEEWASKRNISEHHIKTLYRILLKPPSLSSQSSCSPLQMTPEELATILIQNDFPKVHAYDLLLNTNKNISDGDGNMRFVPMSSKVASITPSSSNGGAKLGIELKDGSIVETVVILHDATATSKNSSSNNPNNRKRYTVCVSSQIGCSRGCTFCATGTMGLRGQLSSALILEQVVHANQYVHSLILDDNNGNDLSANQPEERTARQGKEIRKQQRQGGGIRNVVFMGMGEPLDNYAVVHEACRGLTHQCLFGLKGKHVTISTVGATPQNIARLAKDAPNISLAISLHGATTTLREALIPSASLIGHGYDNGDHLQALGWALDQHAVITGKGAMIEYLLIDGVNDGKEAADALGQFCLDRGKALALTANRAQIEDDHSTPSKELASSPSTSTLFVNLIPYNPTIAGTNFGYTTPSDDAVLEFSHRLRDKFGVRSLIRWSSASGRDADGACGQLAIGSQSKTQLRRHVTTKIDGKSSHPGNDANNSNSKREVII